MLAVSVIAVSGFLLGVSAAIDNWWMAFPVLLFEGGCSYYYFNLRCLSCGFPVFRAMAPYNFSVPEKCPKCLRTYE